MLNQQSLAYYRNFGFDQNSLSHSDPSVRLEAYRALGFPEEALDDPSAAIRLEAQQYFKKYLKQ